ncbi:MAG: hypothetical protein HZA77_07410 [Candidatus Schekmanbacteria bacterium]|nr:hypothetical protein [Candidatus Schekmanbacteria bacterium]
MPEVIFDCCVLSNFALSDSFNIVKSIYANTSYITDFVSVEILKGFQKGYTELAEIRNAVRDGWIKEIALSGKEEKNLFESLSISLGLGEASSIAVAKTRELVFACDDKAARYEANYLKVKLTGTLGILKKAVNVKNITLKEADSILNRMIGCGFYSPVNSIKDIP